MFTKLIRRIAGSLCVVFAVIALVAILDVMDFTSPIDLLAGAIVGLVMVVLPGWIGVRWLDLRTSTPRKTVPQESSTSRVPPPPLPPPPVEPDKKELEVDVLQLARRKGGRLTVLEVVTELEVGVGDAQAVLEDLQLRGIAGILVSDSGLIVYSFHELKHLDEKDSARPVTGNGDPLGA